MQLEITINEFDTLKRIRKAGQITKEPKKDYVRINSHCNVHIDIVAHLVAKQLLVRANVAEDAMPQFMLSEAAVYLIDNEGKMKSTGKLFYGPEYVQEPVMSDAFKTFLSKFN